MDKNQPSGINIVTKVWIIAIYSAVSFAIFALALSFLYYSNMKSTYYSKIEDIANSIYLSVDNLSSINPLFYKEQSFKNYIERLNDNIDGNIFIANQDGILLSFNTNEEKILHKQFIDEIPKNSQQGTIEHEDLESTYIISYKSISYCNLWIYYEVDKNILLFNVINDLKQLFILLFLMSFVILLLAGVFSSSIRSSISSLHNNIAKFLRSRNVSKTTINYHDELYDIYNLFCDYSIKIQEASLIEDVTMIKDMENVIGELKDGNFSVRVDNNSKKEVLTKTRVLINDVMEILNAHLNNVLDISKSYIENDFSPAIKDGINQDLSEIYTSMNTLGEKFSNITSSNMEVAMNVEDTNNKITTNINTFKESFQEQLLTLDDMIENITSIYDRMDLNFDISKSIQETSNDVLDISKKYKNFSDNSIDYVSQISDTSSQVTQYLEEIEYYSNKAKMLSLNTSIKSAQYGEIGNLFGYFNKEFKEIALIFSTNIANIKEIISYNIELGKDFYSQYDVMNYKLLVKKINQISGFAKSIDKNTQVQFEGLSVLHGGIDNLYDKNKATLENAKHMQSYVNDSTNMLDKLVSFLNK